ncbi:hypothetical protein QZH41_013509, partial [Actinostola sp. cb2023]
MYKGDCPQHGPLDWIKTTRAVDSTHYTPSIASLPDGLLLKESGIPGNDMGVFAARLIYKRTMFGPFQGKQLFQNDIPHGKDLTYSWDLLKEGIPNSILDGSDEKNSNWMRFVTYARDKREQNLIAFQFQGHIFYRTFRDVYPGEELMIWYEDEYTCTLDELQGECSKDRMPEFTCQRCRLVFAGSTYLYKHHKFRCPDGPLHSTYGARTTGLVGALFRLPVAIANDSWSSPVTNSNESKPRSENEAHHGRRKRKPRKLPRPSEIEETWNSEPQMSDVNENEADLEEAMMVMLPPDAQALNANNVDDNAVELENNNTNYLKRLTSDEISAPQLEKKPKLDNGVIVEVDENDNKYPYHCGTCGKMFARPTWWAKHESGCKEAANSGKQNQDKSRDREETTPPMKTRKEPYECRYCKKTFACPSWRTRHEKVHSKHLKTNQEEPPAKSSSTTMDGSTPHVCDTCGKGFSFPSRLARHRAQKHPPAKAPAAEIPQDTRKHVCRDCGRGFAVAAWLTRHRMKAHTNNFSKKHMCGVCGRSFAVAFWLTRHQKIHQESGAVDSGVAKAKATSTSVQSNKKTLALPWVCGECGLRFRFISWLKRHQKNNKHTNGYYEEQEKTQWLCDRPSCDRIFQTKHHLARHRKAHLDKENANEAATEEPTPFVCEVENCGRKFQTKRMFTRHTMKHSKSTSNPEELPNCKSECSVCCKVFGTKDLLERHFKRIHGNEGSAVKNQSTGRGPPYVCKHCDKEFDFPLQFGRHVATHKRRDKTPKAPKVPRGKEDNQTYRCEGCNLSFKSHDLWSKHVAAQHNTDQPTKKTTSKRDGNYPFECDICGRRFAVSFWLTRHKREHLKDHPHRCDECGQSFAVMAWLTRHKRKHETAASSAPPLVQDLPHRCDECGRSFAVMAWLTRHKRQHETAASAPPLVQDLPHRCDECGRSFAVMAWLTRHKRQHETAASAPPLVQDLPHRCDECGRSFAVMAWLTRHKRQHETAASAPPIVQDLPHQCDECGRSFAVMAWLTRHKRQHETAASAPPIVQDLPDVKPEPITRGNTKVYKCDVCGMEFPWPSWLMKHRKLHQRKLTKVKVQKEKPKTTGKKKKRKKAAVATDAENFEGKNVNEMFEMIEKNGVKQYECIACKKSTVWHTGIIYHIRVHHTHERPFKCHICSKGFHMSGDLTKHNRRHTGEKPFYCQHCKKRFATSQQVRKHEVVHSQTSPFHCKHCGKGYRDRSSVWRHIARKSCPQMPRVKADSESKTSATSVQKKQKKTLKSERQDADTQTCNPEKLVKLDKPDKSKKAEKLNKPEKLDKPDKSIKAEKLNKPEKLVNLDKPEKLNKPDKLDKLVKPDKLEKRAKMKKPVKNSFKKMAKKKTSFLCKNCSKSFPSSDLFKAHIESYKEADQIVCEYCGKCWVRTADLKRHLRVHTGERPYLCPDCGLGFKVSDALKRHMQKLHPKSTKKMIKVKTEPATPAESKHFTVDTTASTKDTEVTDAEDVQEPVDTPSEKLQEGENPDPTSDTQCSVEVLEELDISEPLVPESIPNAPDSHANEEVSGVALEDKPKEAQNGIVPEVATEDVIEHPAIDSKPIDTKK